MTSKSPWQASILGLLLSALCVINVAVATTRPIGPEESPVADGLTISTYLTNCTSDAGDRDCGTNEDYQVFPNTPTAGDDGKLRFICEPSHLRYDDPIVYPGQPGVAHLHQFFGNTLADANSTYASLRTTGDGSCQGGPLNRTAYWFPAMIKTDTQKVVVPDFIELYYNHQRRNLYDDGSGGKMSPACVTEGGSGLLQDGRPAACPSFAAGPFERGMKFITGAYPSTGTFPSTYVRTSFATGRNFDWSCTGSASKDVLWDSATPSNGVQGCPAGTTVQVRLDTPSCWNGAYDHTDHYSHLAFETQDGYSGAGGGLHCPDTHPYRLVQLTIIIAWSHEGEADYSTWKLSSDIFNGNNFRAGETFHTDWFGAWNDTIQDTFHSEINGMHSTPGVTPYTSNASGMNNVGGTHVRDSTNGGLGNNTRLIHNSVDITATPTGSRYIDIPASTSKRGRRGRMR